MSHKTLEVRLTHDGAAPLAAESFEVVSRALPDPSEGELVIDVSYASLDPAQRIRMRAEGAGFVPPAGVVGTVVASRSEEFAEGDVVTAPAAWASTICVTAASAERYEAPAGVPLHHAVGLLGLTGLTAYFGVHRVLRPQPDERIAVTGAYGGVGQVAAQLAAASGADVLGVAGGPAKVAGLERLGITAVDHRSPDWLATVDEWAEEGLDGIFENVWGATSARLAERLRPFGRVAVCGQMSGIGGPAVPALPIDDWFRVVTRSLTIRGFRAADFAAENAAARKELAELVAAGSLTQETQVVPGWEAAGGAFSDLMEGRTVGKLVVEVRS